MRRADVGRPRAVAKADLVLADRPLPAMRPLREPLRALVYSAADRAVRDVFVDGRQVVRDGAVLTIDAPAAAERLEVAQRASLAGAAERDRLGRDAGTRPPLAMPASISVSISSDNL